MKPPNWAIFFIRAVKKSEVYFEAQIVLILFLFLAHFPELLGFCMNEKHKIGTNFQGQLKK